VTPYRCPYLAICRQPVSKTNVPGGYRLLADVHPELARAGQAAQGVLFDE
jgi:hypothetical protein